MNNIEVSLEYIQSLRRSLSEECAALLIQNREIGKDKLESCLNDLGAVTHKFKDVLDVSYIIYFRVSLILDEIYRVIVKSKPSYCQDLFSISHPEK